MSIEEVENEKFRIFLEKFENYESYLDFFVSEKDLNYLGKNKILVTDNNFLIVLRS